MPRIIFSAVITIMLCCISYATTNAFAAGNTMQDASIMSQQYSQPLTSPKEPAIVAPQMFQNQHQPSIAAALPSKNLSSNQPEGIKKASPQQPVKLPPPITKEIEHTWQVDPDWEQATYSFKNEEFINPKIVESMQGPLADNGPNLVSIAIKNANLSNQFFSEMHVRPNKDGYPYVYFSEGTTEFGYRFIGATSTGIQIVHTIAHYSGSGAFHTLVFFIYTTSNKIAFDTAITTPPVQKLTLIGSLPLGDSFSGTIDFNDDTLKVLPPKNTAQPLPLYQGGIILQFN